MPGSNAIRTKCIQAYLTLGPGINTGGGAFHLPFSQPPFAPLITGGGALPQVPPPAGQPGGGIGAFLTLFLRLYLLKQHERTIRMKSTPMTDARAMTRVLLSSIQLLISLPTVDPLHRPFEHLPPPPQEVPSRKFCCML